MRNTGVDPILDIGRLADIGRLRLDQIRPDPTLEAIVEQAAHRLSTPYALLGAVLSNAQAFLATYGLPDALASIGGLPLEWTFCQHTVRRRAPLVVSDARLDWPYRDLLAVTGLGIQSYAGVPLISVHGYAVGTLCVLDNQPHPFTDADVQILVALADEAMHELAT